MSDRYPDRPDPKPADLRQVHPSGGGDRLGSPASPRLPILDWMVYIGEPAPDFELPDQHGQTVRSADLRGRWVLLWWYPKASTPG